MKEKAKLEESFLKKLIISIDTLRFVRHYVHEYVVLDAEQNECLESQIMSVHDLLREIAKIVLKAKEVNEHDNGRNLIEEVYKDVGINLNAQSTNH